MKSFRALLIGLALLGLSAHAAVADGPTNSKPDDATKAAKSQADGSHAAAKSKSKSESEDQHPMVPYLGVQVRPLHEMFWKHFRDELEHRQGVVVEGVSAGSPAEKAGLKSGDTLMTFGDQKLYSPHQLMSLIRDSKAGSEVKLGYQRKDKTETATATLAQKAMPNRHTADHRSVDKDPSHGSNNDPSQWSSFDSLTIKSLGNNHYQAQVSYLDKSGKVESRKFEGTRDEIRQDISSRADMPQNEQKHLIRAMNLSNQPMQFDAPRVYRTDDGRVIWEFSEPVFPFYSNEMNDW